MINLMETTDFINLFNDFYDIFALLSLISANEAEEQNVEYALFGHATNLFNSPLNICPDRK